MLRVVLILSIVSVGLVAAVYNRYAALLLYLWFAFFRPQEWVSVDITSFRLSLIIAVFLVLPAFGTGTFPNARHPVARGILALLALSLVAELTTSHPRDSWNWLQQISLTALVDLLLITIVDSAHRLRWVVVVVVCSVGYYTAKQGAIALLKPGTRIAEGIGGAFGDNNSYAVVCAMLVFLLLGLARTGWRHQWVRVGFRMAAGLSVVTCISTFSRGGFLAVVAGLLAFSVAGGLRLRWVAALAGIGLILWAVAPLPEGYTDRLRTMQTYEEDESAAGRLHFWKVALIMSAAEPLGVGIQNFDSVYDQYDFSDGQHGHARSVHNSHLQILTEAGVLGFFDWIFLLLYSLYVTYRVRRRVRSRGDADTALFTGLSDGLCGALVAFIVGGTFTAVGWSDFVWCVLAITATLDYVSRGGVVTAAAAMIETPSMSSTHLHLPHTARMTSACEWA